MVAPRKLDPHGLLPTPPIPEDLPAVSLGDNARQVLLKRYVRRGDDGKPCETVEEMFWRVAYHVAKVENAWQGDVTATARDYYHLLAGINFFPNSPTFTGAGRAPALRTIAKSFASSRVNPPVIDALPPEILSFTTGAE